MNPRMRGRLPQLRLCQDLEICADITPASSGANTETVACIM